MSSVAVRELPRCEGCGEEARWLCDICNKPYCTNRGCPQNEQHHRSTTALVVMTPIGDQR